MTDPFLAYLDKMEADFRAALENLTRARKVYASFLASRGTAAVARDTVPGDGGGTAVNALAALPAAVANDPYVQANLRSIARMEGETRGETVVPAASVEATAPIVDSMPEPSMPAGDRCDAPAEPVPSDPGPIPAFLDRRKGTGSAGAEHPPVNATDGAL